MNKLDDPSGLDSPLVVHKKTDSSYQANAAEIAANSTHESKEDEKLERHRFKKEKKSNIKMPIILTILIILCVLFALYFTGVIGDREVDDKTQTTVETTTEAVTTIEEKYTDTIVIKGSYIFVDGYEVDGIDGLQSAIKYEDPSPKRYTFIQENIDERYYNNEILPILTEMGFYDETTEVTIVHSTGLMAAEEVTTEPETTTVVEENVEESQENLE